jgi:hypothetical protein
LWHFNKSEWGTHVLSVSSTSEWKFEEEVVFLVLMQKELEKKKKKHKFWVEPLLKSRLESGILTLY